MILEVIAVTNHSKNMLYCLLCSPEIIEILMNKIQFMFNLMPTIFINMSVPNTLYK